MEFILSLSRHRFVRRIGTGMAAPLILRATKKSGSNKPILGEGEHTYGATHDRGELPPDIEYGNTHRVCVDSQGHVTSTTPCMRFTLEGSHINFVYGTPARLQF
jgi:hypothetical protein